MTTVLQLEAGKLVLRIARCGGSVLSFVYDGETLLQPVQNHSAAGVSACFPMVPICNRVPGNQLNFAGKVFPVSANTLSDPLHIHGEGWLADWSVAEQGAHFVELVLQYDGHRLPHRFEARQRFTLTDEALSMTLSVRNMGAETMPFGIGWHPFFPLTPQTKLTFSAQRMWREGEDHLPDVAEIISPPYDFQTGAYLPNQWINNAFDSWQGNARIVWAERSLAMDISVSSGMDVLQLYRPVSGDEFFAFEPMSHLPGKAYSDNAKALTPLAYGDILTGTLMMRPEHLLVAR
ncbi:aldose 1-epimerase [Marinomonas sp.]|uniref:aldose 1-epimerase n=1 Tax=Marinomonas sp. TaxID=1904862 RepID=UPI003BAB5DBF